MIGDHQRESHSASRRLIRSPYSSSSFAFDSYHCGRSQPAASKKTRAELLLAREERRQAHVAVRLPLLRRVDDAVRLVEALGRARLHVPLRLLVLVEARDVGRLQVDLRLAVRHPLRDRLADARAFLHPDRGRRPEALHLGRLAEQRQPVGGQREEAVDRVLDPDRLVVQHLRDQLERVLHLLLEVLLRERELRRRKRRLLVRRNLLGVVEDRTVGVRADLEPAPVLALVHVRVHVAHDRELDHALRVLEVRHRPDVDHLVHRRRQRDRRAGHARDLRAPDTAADDDAIGRDVAARGLDPASRARPRRRCRAPRCSRTPTSAPFSCARSRAIVPNRSESTMPTDGV